MYLGNLNQDAKTSFWTLALDLVTDEDGMKEEERQMMLSYQQEMGFSDKDIPQQESVDNAVKRLIPQKSNAKKIVFFELLALTKADSDYSTDERVKMDRLQKMLGISNSTATALESVLDEILLVYQKTAKLIMEE